MNQFSFAYVRKAAWVAVTSLGLEFSAYGQRLSFGVVGGTNLTSSFPGTDFTSPAEFGKPRTRYQYFTGPRTFITGALLEGHFNQRFSIEASALHRPMKTIEISTEMPDNGIHKAFTGQFTGVRVWEFPVLFKYTASELQVRGRPRPFVTIGPSFRTQEDAAGSQPSQIGVSAGVGAAFQVGRLRLAPTLRYTRWAREQDFPRFDTKPDQLEVLASVTYETGPGSRRFAGRKLEIGAIVGLPFTHNFQTPVGGVEIVERARYLAGLTVQMTVVGNLAMEVNAIYKPLRAGSDNLSRFSVLTWQFPVLAKYSWAEIRLRPFAEAGPSFRLSGNLNGFNPSHYGITVGGGLDLRRQSLRLSPALRYTRWASDRYPSRLAPGVRFDESRTEVNAVELVFGVSF